MAVQPWGQPSPYGQSPYGQSPSPYGQPWQPAHTPQSSMRAAHADRERAVDVLKAAYAEGRLSAEEYSQRFDAAHRAQTYGELGALVADLPAGPMVAPFGAVVPVVPPTFLPPPMPMPRRTNPLAIGSLVLGLLCLPTWGLTGLPALITGHIARNQIRERGEEGTGMATAGVVLGWLSVGFWALIVTIGLFATVAGH